MNSRLTTFHHHAMLRSLALLLLLSPAAVFAGLFGDSPVKMLDPKGFKKVMKNKVSNGVYAFRLHPLLLTKLLQETSMVAFTAPWCGVRATFLYLLRMQIESQPASSLVSSIARSWAQNMEELHRVLPRSCLSTLWTAMMKRTRDSVQNRCVTKTRLSY